MPDPTPAALWREEGKTDPFGERYNCARQDLVGGAMTDDEIANAVFMNPDIANLTAAKDRIRWLSRQLAAPVTDARAVAALDEFYGRDPDTSAPFSPEEIERMKAAIAARPPHAIEAYALKGKNDERPA
jgi:hypothetical protein